MLEPQDRLLLLDCLRPPEGYVLDRAIGTTYSLDLEALLLVPFAFTMFGWDSEDGRLGADPLLALEAVRRSAERIMIFCQAGRISVPPHDQRLLPYLEGSVHEVVAPTSGGIFHPKVWVLRFTPITEGRVRYRFVCLTRNLTFDRSWDLVLTLEGELRDRSTAIARNHPLGDFLEALPGMAVRRPGAEGVRTARQFSEEVRKVNFEPPAGFEGYRFHPLGTPNGRVSWPFDADIQRLLVISPFLSNGCLKRLTQHGSGHCLVSRVDSLCAISQASLRSFDLGRIYTLDDGACVTSEGDSGSGVDDGGSARASVTRDARGQGEVTESTGPSETAEPVEPADPAEPAETVETVESGLHAKVYVSDEGRTARLWVGSANATNAAFNRNVEFLVELSGKRSVCGIDAILEAKDGQTSLGSLLQRFMPPGTPVPADEVSRRLEKRLADITRAVSTAGLAGRVEATGDEHFDVTLCRQPGCRRNLTEGIGKDATIRVWPVTLGPLHAQVLDLGAPTSARFARLSFEALTSFFAIEVEATVGGRKGTHRFALNLELIDAPANRRERVLFSLLKDERQLMRLILLLLNAGTDGLEAVIVPNDTGHGPGRQGWSEFVPSRFFESLVRALGRSPERLDEVARLVEELRANPHWGAVIPAAFDEIWRPIWEARLKLPGAPAACVRGEEA